MTTLEPVDSRFVTDATPADKYPGAGVGESNIYSCRYGIHFYTRKEFSPPKREVFASILLDTRPELAQHAVVLERLDVYRNLRLARLSAAGGIIGGGLGSAIRHGADRKTGTATGLPGFSIERDPPIAIASGENQVGCDGKGEGEYLASTVDAGHSVIVIWLTFTVDGHRYAFRSMYAYQFEDALGHAKAVQASVDGTIASAASQVDLL